MALIAAPWTTQTSGIATSIGAYAQTDLLRIPYVSQDRPYLNDGSALFWRFLNMLPAGEAVDQARFEFFVDNKFETQTTAGAGASDSATALTVADANILLPNQVLYNQRTEEQYYVTATPTSTTATIEREWGGTTAAAILEDDVLVILLTNLPEGADANSGNVKLPTKDYNYVSFFSETISETDVQKMTNMRWNVGKTQSSYTDTYNKLMEQMDNMLRFGVRHAEERSAGTVYQTGGFKSIVGQEIDVSYGASPEDLSDLFANSFRHTASSPMKVMLCGEKVHDRLIATQRAVEPVSPTKFNPVIGAMVTRINLQSGGTIDVMVDRQGFSPNRNMQNDYFLVDAAHIRRRPFNGFEDIVSRDITSPESHTMKDELFGATGLEICFPDDVHAYGTFEAS